MGNSIGHFKITGEFVTNHARSFVYDGLWQDGLRFLMDSFCDLSYDVAISVLSGSKRFVGVNNFDLEDETSEIKSEYLEELDGIYGGVLRYKNKYYRAYAVVTNYGPRDMNCARIVNYGTIKYFDRERHYMNDRLKDISFSVDYKDFTGGVLALFEEISFVPPPWIPVCRNPQEAFNNSTMIVQERGYKQWYAELDEIEYRQVVGNTVEANDAEAEAMISYGKLRRKEREEEEERAFKEFQKEIEEYRIQIINVCNNMKNGWMPLNIENEDGNFRTIMIPRAPFENWILGRTNGRHLAMNWKNICPQGLKMENDNEYHSDMLVGAGIDITDRENTYGNEKLNNALNDAAIKFLNEKLNFDCVVLSGNDLVFGKVVHPKPDERVPEGSIIVIPNGDVRYFIPMVSACKNGKGAVIMENGGELCHLAVNGKPHNFVIVRVKDATKLYPEGIELTVDASRGKIQVRRVM